MIKFPAEVKRVLKILADKGYMAYSVGGCVRSAMSGKKPVDWDITTSARLEQLKELFPDARVLSEKYSVIRIDSYNEETGEDGIIVDIATFRKDGVYSNGRRPETVSFVDTIEEDLSRRDFTINAMADNGFSFVDPYNGKSDMDERLIRTIGDPKERLLEDPVRMLRAIRIASEMDFDLSKSVYEVIRENYRELEKISIDRFRTEFVKILASEHAGKGLNMLMDTGIINLIFGDETVKHLTHREKSDLMILCKNISRSKAVPERRLGLLYTTLSERKALNAIARMNFDKVTEQHLVDAAKDLPRLFFCVNKEAIKKFIYEHESMERYNYLLNLEKAQRLVFDYDSETKIRGKMYFLDEIIANNEPIFVEDLAIDGDDLLEAGICEEGEEVGKMLRMIVEHVHSNPNKNNRTELLALAKKYKKNKLSAITRNIKWSR